MVLDCVVANEVFDEVADCVEVSLLLGNCDLSTLEANEVLEEVVAASDASLNEDPRRMISSEIPAAGFPNIERIS